MSWLNRLGRFFGIRAATPTNPGRWFIDWIRNGEDSASGVPVGADSAQRSSAVYACDQVIRQDVAKVPLYLYRTDGKSRERAVDHPLYSLLGSEPNSRQTSYEWRDMMQHHFNLRGNSYSLIERDGRRTPNALVPVHPDWVKVLSTPDGELFYDIRMFGRGDVRRYSSLDVLHIRDRSDDGLTGKSRLSQARDVIGLDIAQSTHASKLFANGARPGGIIKTAAGTKMGLAGRDLLRKEWNDQFQGVDNAHKVFIADGGMEYQPVIMNNVDAEFIEGRKLTRSEIAAIFRVPAHKIGILENATFSNIEHQALEYVYDTLFPLFSLWEQKLNMMLLRETEKGTLYFEFDRDVLLRGDFKTRMDGFAVARNWGWMSANDVRRELGMNPIPEGGDEYLVPLNTWPAGVPRPDKAKLVGDGTTPPDQQPSNPNSRLALPRPNGEYHA